MITAAEWKKVEEQLKSFYSIVKLKCDEFELSLRLERYNQFKNVIAIYVNGEIQGKWLSEDCEERRRFFRPVTKSFFSTKERAKIKRLPKKQRLDLENRSKYTYYLAHWTSFTSLKNHLKKNNQSIELISE